MIPLGWTIRSPCSPVWTSLTPWVRPVSTTFNPLRPETKGGHERGHKGQPVQGQPGGRAAGQPAAADYVGGGQDNAGKGDHEQDQRGIQEPVVPCQRHC